MHAGSQKIHVQLIGEFRVRGANGENLTPRPMACALLALLALTPGHSRSRVYLQDKLWSEHGPAEAGTNLRRLLADIRRSFGAYRDCLTADRRVVGLREERLRCDIDDRRLLAELSARPGDAPTLLENLSFVRDPEFEDWLRDARADFERKLDTSETPNRAPGRFAAQPTIAAPPWFAVEHLSSGAPAEEINFLTAALGGEISRRVRDSTAVELISATAEEAWPSGVGLILKTRLLAGSRYTNAHAALHAWPSNELRWSCTAELPLRGRLSPTATHEFLGFVNQAVDAVLFELAELAANLPYTTATGLGLEAVRRMFRFEESQLAAAEKLLCAANEISSRPVFLALRAFLRTIYVGERLPCDRLVLSEEARQLVRDARQAAPHNSSVLALSSHVQGFMLGERATGGELANFSLRCNPSNVLAMAVLARAQAHAGRVADGYRTATAARAIAGHTPHRVLIDFNACVAAILSGRHEQAVRLAEIAHGIQPRFLPAMRYLFALHLHRGNRAQAREVFAAIRRLEPDFGLRLLREPYYPNTGLLTAGILPKADAEFD